MQDGEYLRERAYPLTPEQRAELARLRKLSPLAFVRLRATYYRHAKRDRALAELGYELYEDQWHREHLRCLLCRMSWNWPVTIQFREIHRNTCQRRY
jgi:hypothetical protein